MPMSPAFAIHNSPAAVLTPDEEQSLAALIEAVDDLLLNKWPGSPFGMNGPGFYTAKVAARFQRAYEEAGWFVDMAPRDGALGKAPELLAAGAALQWSITLRPNWRQP